MHVGLTTWSMDYLQFSMQASCVPVSPFSFFYVLFHWSSFFYFFPFNFLVVLLFPYYAQFVVVSLPFFTDKYKRMNCILCSLSSLHNGFRCLIWADKTHYWYLFISCALFWVPYFGTSFMSLVIYWTLAARAPMVVVLGHRGAVCRSPLVAAGAPCPRRCLLPQIRRGWMEP